MQNEFEKQVQKKMEELNLVPSAPVWMNIQEQVRKTKGRRRRLIWIPLLLLLAGAGIWGYYQVQRPDVNNPANPESRQAPITNETETGKKDVTLPTPPVHQQLETDQMEDINSVEMPVTETKIPTAKTERIVSRKDQPFNQTATLPREQVVPTHVRENPENTIVQQQTAPTNLSADKQNQISSDTSKGVDKAPIPEKVIKGVLTGDTSMKLTDSLRTKKVVQTRNQKWEYGLHADVGSSALVRGLSLFATAKSMDFATPSTGVGSGPGPGIPLPASEETRGLSYSFGVRLRKELSDRVHFVTGLSYNFYSTHIMVGQSVQRDTVVLSNQNAVRVSEYYRNAVVGLSDYQNNYHFVSVPFAIDYQPVRKVPFNLHFGLSIQQLVSTNALVYNSTGMFYHEDKEAFRKTQVAANMGLGYSFHINDLSVSAGPQLQFGLSNHVRNGGNRHLMLFGINSNIYFNKK